MYIKSLTPNVLFKISDYLTLKKNEIWSLV